MLSKKDAVSLLLIPRLCPPVARPSATIMLTVRNEVFFISLEKEPQDPATFRRPGITEISNKL